jgi:hypothetical protein
MAALGLEWDSLETPTGIGVRAAGSQVVGVAFGSSSRLATMSPVAAWYPPMQHPIQVKIMMDNPSRHAVITLNWGQVIRSTELLESEMAVFFFKEQEDNFLCLNMFTGIPA